MAGSFLIKAHLVPLGILAVYTGFLCAMLTPVVQKHFVFLHKIKFPFFPNFDHPEKYGMAPFKTRNLQLTAKDGVKIGAWHILPEEFYQQEVAKRAQKGVDMDGPLADALFDDALRLHPTVIYLHGNAANRAAPFRIRTYSHLTARLPANVISIDYRGFGDSEGDPSEAGLVLDARAAWDFVRARTQRPGGDGIVIFGQSLGTGVAAALTHELYTEGQSPQAVVLMAAYSSLKAVIANFRVFGLVPLLAPLHLLSGLDYLMEKFQTTKFATDERLPHLLSPPTSLNKTVSIEAASAEESDEARAPNIVILHADDDAVIPISHGQQLWDGLVQARQDSVTEAAKAWSSEQVRRRHIMGFGHVWQFDLDGVAPRWGRHDLSSSSATATFIRTLHGGHDHLSEGAVDEVGKAAGLYRGVQVR